MFVPIRFAAKGREQELGYWAVGRNSLIFRSSRDDVARWLLKQSCDPILRKQRPRIVHRTSSEDTSAETTIKYEQDVLSQHLFQLRAYCGHRDRPAAGCIIVAPGRW